MPRNHALEEQFPDNKELLAIADQIAAGMALCISKKDGSARLLARHDWPGTAGRPNETPVRWDIAQDLLKAKVGEGFGNTPLLTELTEHDNNYRIGWRRAGLPGDTDRVYLFTV